MIVSAQRNLAASSRRSGLSAFKCRGHESDHHFIGESADSERPEFLGRIEIEIERQHRGGATGDFAALALKVEASSTRVVSVRRSTRVGRGPSSRNW